MTNARPFKPLSKKDEDEKPLQTPVFAVKYNMGICAAAFIPEREAFERDPRNRRRGNGIFNGKKRYACKGSRKSAVQAECSGAGIHNFPHRRSRNFFAEPKDADELCAMLSAARNCDYPVYIIGNGSNLLVSDSGVEALFIRIGARMAGVGFDGTRLKCGAGALLCTAAKAAVAEGLSGLEWAAGIPGTVGGAVAMNAGAYGGEIKQVLKSVTVVECGRITKKSFMRAILGTEALFTPFRMPLLRERSLNLLLMPTGKLGAEWRNSICAAKKSSRLSILPQEALLNGPRGISQVR